MKLIKPSYEIVKPTGYSLEDIYKSIELAGRVAYKSEDKITEDSAKAFVGRMLNMKHLAACEFGTVYLEYHVQDPSVVGVQKYHEQQEEYHNLFMKYSCNKYSHVNVNQYFDTVFITSNYRVLVENNWLGDLRYLCSPTSHHNIRHTVKFVCDRGISHEFVRHRVFSFLQESTRYCNYSKDKFNNELTFIIPCWMEIPTEGSIGLSDYGKTSARYKYGDLYIIDVIPPRAETDFIRSLCEFESDYLLLINHGWKPEQARAVLPNALKTELYMCGFVEDWEHFFELRDDKQHAHPQAYELAHPLHEDFINLGYCN